MKVKQVWLSAAGGSQVDTATEPDIETENKNEGLEDLSLNLKPGSVQVFEVKGKNGRNQKRAKIIAVEAGWNLNNIFIPKEVLKDLPALMMAKPKLYSNHDLWAFLGRRNEEWVASFDKTWEEKDGELVLGDITFTNNPATAWIYDELERDPNSVEFSIHIQCIMEEYEDKAMKRLGRRVVKIIGYESTDVVGYGAAGGKGLQIYNSLDLRNLDKLITFIETLKNSKSIEEAKEQLNDNSTEQQINSQGENEMPEIKNVADLRAQYGTLVNAIETDAVKQFKTSAETQALSAQKTKLEEDLRLAQTSISEKDAKIEELTNSVKALDEEKVKLQKQLDDINAKEAQESHQKAVQDLLNAAKLDSKYVTDVFKESLMKETDLEKIKTMIEDRKTLVNSTTSTIENGSTISGSDGGVKTINDEDLVNSIKSIN